MERIEGERAPSAQAGADDSARSPIPDGLRPALEELEAYLDGEPPEKLSEYVLVLASTWVLGDAGFDLDRYYREAKTFYEITPEHDRVLASFPDAMASYLVYRLMMNDADEVERDLAVAQLERARAAVLVRAEWLAEDFPLIAEGCRRLVAETADGTPPDDRLWWALARRIGDRYVPEWLLRTSG
jgi:hypothetical protein